MGDEREIGARLAGRRVVYCLVPYELAGKLHEPLRRHFGDDPSVEVIVEQRRRDRRAGGERRATSPTAARDADRRRVRSTTGRRVAERRAAQQAAAGVPPLPRRFRRYAERISFVVREEPSTEQAEDRDTARLIARFQAGETEVFTTLYRRYFDRVSGYLRLILRDAHEAEDLTQQVFISLFEALPRYERRSQPFRAWLFTIVRNQAVSRLRKTGRVDVMDPRDLDHERDSTPHLASQSVAFDWITDRDLLVLVERLPVAQRQVLVLRFMLDMSTDEIARVLGRTTVDVRTLQHRALRFLERRLVALGRTPVDRGRARMRRSMRPANVLRARRYALFG